MDVSIHGCQYTGMSVSWDVSIHGCQYTGMSVSQDVSTLGCDYFKWIFKDFIMSTKNYYKNGVPSKNAAFGRNNGNEEY